MSVRRIHQTLIGLLLLAGSVFVLSDIFGGSGKSAVTTNDAPTPAAKYFVVQATRPVARGSVIHKDDVALRAIGEAPPRGAVTNVEDAVDRVAVRTIATSDVLSDANSTASAKGVAISELIPPGMRAVALHVTEDSAVANLIRPGDKVDVLIVSNASKAVQVGSRLFPPAEAVTVLQNVPVLAVGENTVGGGSSGTATKNVTLVVSPRDAAMIALVRTVGEEYLSLRAAGDESMPVVVPVSSDAFHTKREEPVAAPRGRVRAPVARAIEIISGPSDKIARTATETQKPDPSEKTAPVADEGRK